MRYLKRFNESINEAVSPDNPILADILNISKDEGIRTDVHEHQSSKMVSITLYSSQDGGDMEEDDTFSNVEFKRICREMIDRLSNSFNLISLTVCYYKDGVYDEFNKGVGNSSEDIFNDIMEDSEYYVPEIIITLS